MALELHTIERHSGGAKLARADRLIFNAITVAFSGGDGDPSAIAAGTPGVGYQTIPTVAFANVGSGSGATAAALMGVVAVPTIASGGSGGTPGAVTLTGTDGTGTKFQLTGTINGSGVLSAISAIAVAGSYSVLPASISADPVSGGSLTGATVNLSAALGVVGYTIGGSSNHLYPASGVTATVSGGTPTTAAVPGAVTITGVAGEPATIQINGKGSQTPGLSGLPQSGIYQVHATPSVPCMVSYAKNTNPSTGFVVTLTPLSGVVLAAGYVDIQVTA